jgi:hypothetical protein
MGRSLALCSADVVRSMALSLLTNECVAGVEGTPSGDQSQYLPLF